LPARRSPSTNCKEFAADGTGLQFQHFLRSVRAAALASTRADDSKHFFTKKNEFVRRVICSLNTFRSTGGNNDGGLALI
jgi:hypothetical protein